MQDNGKYLRLFGTLFFTFIAFVAGLILLMLSLRLFFGLLSYIPFITYVFMLFIICVPACLFIPVYIIFYKRTRSHRSPGAKIISYIIFAVALIGWIYFFVIDMMIFFKHYYNAVGEYMSYNMFWLAANVFAIFLVGIIQALTSAKEPDWLDRERDF